MKFRSPSSSNHQTHHGLTDCDQSQSNCRRQLLDVKCMERLYQVCMHIQKCKKGIRSGKKIDESAVQLAPSDDVSRRMRWFSHPNCLHLVASVWMLWWRQTWAHHPGPRPNDPPLNGELNDLRLHEGGLYCGGTSARFHSVGISCLARAGLSMDYSPGNSSISSKLMSATEFDN